MARDAYQGVTEQRKAAIHRREDAQALFEAGRWRGAMYLAGYAVECLLKAKLMERFGFRTLTELEEKVQGGQSHPVATVFTHGLEEWLRLANAWNRLRQRRELWPSFIMANR